MNTVNAKLRHKRGTEASIPVLLSGQFYQASAPSNKLYKGTETGNVVIADIVDQAKKAYDADPTRTTTDKTTVTGAINELNSLKMTKRPVSIAVTVDLFTLDGGIYMSEGAISTDKNYPITSGFAHCTIHVTGLGNGDGTGYRKITLTTNDGKTYVNTQNWSVGVWSGWQTVFDSSNQTVHIKNSDMSNGWINVTDQDWARVYIAKSGRTVQMLIYDTTGSNTSSTAFNLPSFCNSVWLNDDQGSGIVISDRSVTLTKANMHRTVFTYIEA